MESRCQPADSRVIKCQALTQFAFPSLDHDDGGGNVGDNIAPGNERTWKLPPDPLPPTRILDEEKAWENDTRGIRLILIGLNLL